MKVKLLLLSAIEAKDHAAGGTKGNRFPARDFASAIPALGAVFRYGEPPSHSKPSSSGLAIESIAVLTKPIG